MLPSVPTRDLLRLASVNGGRIDAGLLGHVAGVDDDALDACLREALDANVLRVVGPIHGRGDVATRAGRWRSDTRLGPGIGPCGLR
jgi:hypothetical protein